MVTRAQVLTLLDEGLSYDDAGQRLGLPPGKAYLVATGLPADGSAALSEEDWARPGVVKGSTQALANPPHHNPTVKPEILAWVRARAARDLRRPSGSGIESGS